MSTNVSVASQVSPTPPARRQTSSGKPVEVTSPLGYLFKISAEAPKLAPQLEKQGLGGNANAPPGKDYVTVVVHVTNAADDRAEPSGEIAEVDYAQSNVYMAVPVATANDFNIDSVYCQGRPHVPAGLCSSNLYAASVTPKEIIRSFGSQDIPAGGNVDVVLYSGVVPSAAPLGQVALYFCGRGGSCVKIPLPSD